MEYRAKGIWLMATGIIAEYNPFHNGHKYMLSQIREQFPHEPIIACISGSITQRGEMALLDKWTRAKIAVLAGVNLVIELPAVFACRSAQAFGRGGVRLLAATGVVDRLAFGTEYPDLAQLSRAADFEANLYPQELQELLQKGLAYGTAVTSLMQQKLDLPEAMLYEPNTILGLEYLRCLKELKSKGFPAPKPLPITRRGASHGDALPQGSFASGTAIRQLLATHADKESLKKSLMPLMPATGCQAILNCQSYPQAPKIYQLLRYKLLDSTPKELQGITGMNEGLEQSMLHSLNVGSYAEFIRQLTTRRYPSTRIQRLIVHTLLSMRKEVVDEMDKTGPLYLRVLAMDSIGRQLLRQIKNRGRLPLLNKVPSLLNRRDLLHPEALDMPQQMLAMDIAAANLRSLSLKDTSCLYEDYVHSPCYVEKT